MFPCMCPSVCGVLWHPAERKPACARMEASFPLGDPQAVRTSWAFKDRRRPPMPGSGKVARVNQSVAERSADPMSIASVTHQNSGRTAVSMVAVRSLDDVFEFRVFHSHDVAFFELRSSVGDASGQVYSVFFETDARDRAPGAVWSGTAWMPDRARISAPSNNTFDIHAVRSPSAAHSPVESAALYNDGGNWIAVAVKGYEGGLDAEAHAVLSAFRKVYIGVILDQLNRGLSDEVFSNDGELSAPGAQQMFRDISHIRNQYGIELEDA